MVLRRMACTTTEPRTELGFELESFEWTAADRLEVSGRWFGVRGRRFVRPVMNLRVDGRRRRLIAVLDHKPWAPDAEAPWLAAFAWRGEHGAITNARLEVAPDVVLDLPAPGDDAPGATLHPRQPKREPAKPPAQAPRPAVEAAPVVEGAPAVEAAPAVEVAPAVEAVAAVEAVSAVSPAPAVEAAPVVEAAPPVEPAPPSPAPDAAALADAERRLVDERAARERAEGALRDAEARAAALSEHQDSAVERTNELVRLEGELAAARDHIERVERDRVTAQERGDAAEHRLAAFRERAETAERELAASAERADAAQREATAAQERAESAQRATARERPTPPADESLRRRAESAEFELAAAEGRAQAAELEAASLRRRAETAEPRPVPDAVLAARGLPPRHERGWAARAVGLAWIVVLLIVVVVILNLVF